jgi:lipopolysaccharide export system protein LptC
MADVSVFPGTGHSRVVAWLKWLLPMLAAALLLIVGAWPQLRSSFDKLGQDLPRIDLREARDLRMASPRFVGLDRENRPYTVIADVGRQSPEKDDLVTLEAPKADMTLSSGAWVALHAMTGLYRGQTQRLDLFGEVSLFHDNGMTFVSDSAEVDLAAGTAEGNEKVNGHGPAGEIESEGFRILDKGNVIVFSGKASALLNSARETGE